MDLSRTVAYRGLALNTVTIEPNGRLSGIQLSEANYGSVAGVGYTEKRALGDGRDASDVFLDGRRIMLRGAVYGVSRAGLYDQLQSLSSALLPTAAYADEPTEYGYMPLTFWRPTLALADWSTGSIPLLINCRPLASPTFGITRDATGGEEERGGSIPFQVMLEAKDPRIYADVESEVNIADEDTSHAGSFANRGDYPSPLNVLLVVSAHVGAGSWTLTAGGSQLRITLPASANTIIFRYEGARRILTTEENGEENMRMDLLTFLAETTHPRVQPGVSAWSWTSGVVPMQVNSRFWFNEAFA